MRWRVPWVFAWLTSWTGYTPPPGFLSSGTLPDPLIINDAPLDVFAPSAPPPSLNYVAVNLSIENRCISPDGFPRIAVLAGLQGNEPTLPGPVISGKKGDQFLINVTNSLTDTSMLTGTTIHWHGINQYHTSRMDGVAGVTQCVIAPGRSFLHNFTGGTQVGTYWYHSHYGPQYCDGLRGALIIRDDLNDKKNYNYQVDDDSTIITLMDWYHYPSVVTPRQILPDSVLINGTGCYPGMDCQSPPTYMVQQGTRYRFRLLNMACKSYFNFSIEGHNLTVIEADGSYVEPYNVSSITIYAAQRYSFILDANQPIYNYVMHAVPASTDENNSSTVATLMYEGATEFSPSPAVLTSGPLNEACLHSPDTPDVLLGTPNVTYTIDVDKNFTNYNFLVNGTQYQSPTVPILLQIMSGWLSDELEPGKSLIPLDKGMVVELIFNITAPGHPHPFHLHGHHFAVNKSADGLCPTDSGTGMPVFRDTVNTGLTTETNNVTVRFRTDNSGPWFLHCHNDWHLWTGMALVFVEDYEGIKNQTKDANWLDLCPYEPKEYFPLPTPELNPAPYQPTTTVTCAGPTPSARYGV